VARLRASQPHPGFPGRLLGSVDRVPTYDPGPANIPQRVGQADLVEGEPAVIDLPAGRLWLLNSNGVQIRLEACAPATVSATFWPR